MNRDALLEAVNDLAARDERLAAELVVVSGLAGRADAVGSRAHELDAVLAALPDERAALDHDEAIGREAGASAQTALADAEQRLARVGKSRRSEEQRAQAERELARAREAVVDAGRRLDRLGDRRRQVQDEERSALVEAEDLRAEAQSVASAVRELARVSESGRAAPAEHLTGLVAWADRVRAALLVVRSSLDAERDRVVREASELGAAVLGEPLGSASVAVVRRRVEQALRAP